MILSDLGPISKKYRKFEKKNYDQISITGADFDPEKIEKFDDWFGHHILNFYKKYIFEPFLNIQKPSFCSSFCFILHNNKNSVNNNNQNTFFLIT